jgi:hypothetical protein
MKTSTQTTSKVNPGSGSFGAVIPAVVIFIIWLLMVLFPSDANAQRANFKNHNDQNFGVRISLIGSASGLGSFYCPQLYYSRNRFTFLGGPMVQFRKKNISGAIAGAEYSVIGKKNNDWLNPAKECADLFFFATAVYQDAAYLSNTNVRVESRYGKETGVAYDKLKVKTVELYGGFGIKAEFLPHLQWTGSIGLGFYSSGKSSAALYRDNTGLGLILRTGFIYSIGR